MRTPADMSAFIRDINWDGKGSDRGELENPWPILVKMRRETSSNCTTDSLVTRESNIEVSIPSPLSRQEKENLTSRGRNV